jgi:hypothetical protein
MIRTRPPRTSALLQRLRSTDCKVAVPTEDLRGEFTLRSALALYLKSSRMSQRQDDLFCNVQTYCMFVGYPRSGHSILGALIDAHPQAIMGHELDVLQFVDAGFSRNQIFSLLLENSSSFARVGRGWNGRSHVVANQWQGRFEKLKVIGDKKGRASNVRLAGDPELLTRLRSTFGMPIKFIHVVRNPFDNISTICQKARKSVHDKPIGDYFKLVEGVSRIKQRVPAEDFIDLKYEELISCPERQLREVCDFLSLPCTDDYVRDAASVVFSAPHKSRSEASWNDQMIATVTNKIREYDFLSGYSYSD